MANRYRIVSMLGRGGMGEVYRADDLRLGQTVALKFLPPELAKDQKRLEYFHNEVRLARQISHPNVCRVYDIGEVDGQQFISMEYIDGEDLKVLLHRIGRLPKDKGIQIAQQLCSGLAAAHAKGVLHRDLKPANIMIDGQGQVRITDFGLATVATDEETVAGMSGTPAYMAPEQLLRGETSVQSDIYSLGLVLFELFTGQPGHRAGNLAELRRHHEESSVPRSPSEFVADIDPAIERAVVRCINPDPHSRPRSASELSASLPGGDPLAAATAAGETPSPSLVAMSGGAGGLSISSGIACLVVFSLSLVAVVGLSQKLLIVNQIELKTEPKVLAYKAREIIEHLGYANENANEAVGFEYLGDVADISDEGERNYRLEKGAWFWLRQADGLFDIDTKWEAPTYQDVKFLRPGWTVGGMTGVRLSFTGELREFRAVTRVATAIEQSLPDPQWFEWFREDQIGFDLAKLDLAKWDRTPPVVFDTVRAWEGKWPDSERPLHVQAASYRGKPVYFRVFGTDPMEMDSSLDDATGNQTSGYQVQLLIVLGSLCLAIGLAWKHYRERRGDRSGAWKLATYAFVSAMIKWILVADHSIGMSEFGLFTFATSDALYLSARTWVAYLAIEPLVRRLWPQLLISWSRLLNGQITDPRVARDLLVAALLATFSHLLSLLGHWIESGSTPVYPVSSSYLESPVEMFGWLIGHQVNVIGWALCAVFLLAILRAILRSQLIAVLVVVTLFMIPGFLEGESVLQMSLSGVQATIILYFIVRLGLLTLVAASVFGTILENCPITVDTSSLMFPHTIAWLSIFVACVIWAYFSATRPAPGGGQKLGWLSETSQSQIQCSCPIGEYHA